MAFIETVHFMGIFQMIKVSCHAISVGILALTFCSPLSAGEFSLKSSTLKSGAPIPFDQVFNGFGCSGKNISPDLEWSNPPSGTKSFAVTVYDPDAPTGSGWWHWIIFNIPSQVRKLDLNSGQSKSKTLPKGAIQSKTDFGKAGYGGPCPPAGDKPHRYFFRVYALKDILPLTPETPGAQVGYYINQNKLGVAELMVTYQKQ
jgi:Raf kinase inhibitor-like YbhB/YbcL family protein